MTVNYHYRTILVIISRTTCCYRYYSFFIYHSRLDCLSIHIHPMCYTYSGLSVCVFLNKIELNWIELLLWWIKVIIIISSLCCCCCCWWWWWWWWWWWCWQNIWFARTSSSTRCWPTTVSVPECLPWQRCCSIHLVARQYFLMYCLEVINWIRLHYITLAVI